MVGENSDTPAYPVACPICEKTIPSNGIQECSEKCGSYHCLPCGCDYFIQCNTTGTMTIPGHSSNCPALGFLRKNPMKPTKKFITSDKKTYEDEKKALLVAEAEIARLKVALQNEQEERKAAEEKIIKLEKKVKMVRRLAKIVREELN